jgi:hypothetical protein
VVDSSSPVFRIGSSQLLLVPTPWLGSERRGIGARERSRQEEERAREQRAVLRLGAGGISSRLVPDGSDRDVSHGRFGRSSIAPFHL